MSLGVSFFIDVAESAFQSFLESVVAGEYLVGFVGSVILFVLLIVSDEGFELIKRWSGQIGCCEQDPFYLGDEFFPIHMDIHVQLYEKRS